MQRNGVSRSIQLTWLPLRSCLVVCLGGWLDFSRIAMTEPSTEQKRSSMSVPSSSSAMSTVGGASLGTLIGSGIAVVSLAFIGPVAVAVPSLITLAGGGIGALGGYLRHKHQEERVKRVLA